MPEYAPTVLVKLGKKIADSLPGGQFSGVLGDASHVYGYHRARKVLPGSDYSVKLKRDREGDGWAASAVDVTFSQPISSQYIATKRLMKAAKAKDPRLRALREFFGSLDGSRVDGWDLAKHEPSTSDDQSHKWHLHLSVYRKYANDSAAVAGIASVIAGDDMALTKSDVKKIFHTDDVLSSKDMGYSEEYCKKNPGMSVATALEISRRDVAKLVHDLEEIKKLLKARP